MGSLSSRPKVPSAPQVVYVPQPTTPTSSPDPVDTVTNSEAVSKEAREENLLRRSRGTAGTVLTGFRGLLETIGGNQSRKTLLGE
jgi:hypothetical protein